MSMGHEVIDLRTRREPSGIAELRDEWGRLSRERIGLTRQEWVHPATGELLRAIHDGTDVQPALIRFGTARAEAGVGLAETYADLAVLQVLLPPQGHHAVDLASLATAAVVGAAWAEAASTGLDRTSCIDELTGLVTAPFLEARLEQIYRHCAYLDLHPGDAYALVVAQLARFEPSPFTRVARRLRLAGDLRLCFPGSDTLAVLEATTAAQTMVALTSQGPDLAAAVEALSAGAGERRVWVEALPAEVGAAVELVRSLPAAD